MRTLKAFGLFLVIAILGIGITSCSDDPYESRINELVIKDVIFSSDASTDTQTFRNEDLSNYEATPSESWCSVTLVNETAQMIVKAEANETYDERKAIVTIKDKNDATKSRTFTVTQAQKDGLIVDVTDAFMVPTEGDLISFEVRSNIAYQVYIPKEYSDWLKQVTAAGTRGLESKTIYVAVSKNESGKSRTGYVAIVNSKDNSQVTWITINQKFDIVFSVDPQSITVDELRHEISINVNANIPIDVNDYPDWVQKGTIEEKDDENFVYKMIVTPFTEKKLMRQGTIVFENAGYFKEVAVSITQNRLLYIEESEINVNVGGRLGLTLRNDTGQEVTWTSSNEKVATVTKDGTVIGVSEGKAKVTVASADGKYSDYVEVNVNNVEGATLDVTGWSTTKTSIKCTLINKETERGITLSTIDVTRVTEDGDQKTTQFLKTIPYNVSLLAGGERPIDIEVEAPTEESATATYSYILGFNYYITETPYADFKYIATEK